MELEWRKNLHSKEEKKLQDEELRRTQGNDVEKKHNNQKRTKTTILTEH